MSINEVVKQHKRWRTYTAEKSRAQLEVQKKLDTNNAEIARLREDNIRIQNEFDILWKAKKIEIQEARDIAVMEELATGRSAQSILKELGSNNTVWIYDLRAKVQAAGGLPEAVNANTPIHSVNFPQAEPQHEPAVLPDVTWLHHGHQGVVGWLVSDNHAYIKRYGAEGTDFEGQWFICDRDKTFIGGNRELFDATPKAEVTRKYKLLLSLLDESYAGKVKIVDNPYTD